MLGKILSGVAAVLVLAALLLAAWYQVDGQPLPEARDYLTGEGYTAREAADGSLEFLPARPSGHGLLIMHGALIKPLAYARTAAFFAGQGYTVVVPAGTLRLSILALDSAVAALDRLPVLDWYFIGHSMGGLSSLELLARHPAGVRAVALWAAAMPEDHSGVTLPVLYLHGDRDGLLPPDRLSDARTKLPPSTAFVNVAGGNHRNFALYSHQFFDDDATIGADEQIDIANRETAAFFAAH
jgi:pimeloyl-ACP methyl ester carboxylesterase